jgi:hypothetical protein
VGFCEHDEMFAVHNRREIFYSAEQLLFSQEGLCSLEWLHVTSTRGKVEVKLTRGGTQDCETSRLPHFLGNYLTDWGEVVSLTPRPPFTLRNIPGTLSFIDRVDLRAVRLEGLGLLKKCNDIIGNRSLLACSIVPQTTTLPHTPLNKRRRQSENVVWATKLGIIIRNA